MGFTPNQQNKPVSKSVGMAYIAHPKEADHQGIMQAIEFLKEQNVRLNFYFGDKQFIGFINKYKKAANHPDIQIYPKTSNPSGENKPTGFRPQPSKAAFTPDASEIPDF